MTRADTIIRDAERAGSEIGHLRGAVRALCNELSVYTERPATPDRGLDVIELPTLGRTKLWIAFGDEECAGLYLHSVYLGGRWEPDIEAIFSGEQIDEWLDACSRHVQTVERAERDPLVRRVLTKAGWQVEAA